MDKDKLNSKNSLPKTKDEALDIASEFLYSLRYGDKSCINSYTEEQIKSALSWISPSYKDHPWYKEMDRLIEERYDKEKKSLAPKDELKESDILYEISFTMNYEVVLNNLVVLSKPNLNSENTDVFSYLIKNPNKKVTKKEIESTIGKKIGKDFHKITENLGFTGDLRRAFFVVSNDAIIFRNPIKKVDFNLLAIPSLRICSK